MSVDRAMRQDRPSHGQFQCLSGSMGVTDMFYQPDLLIEGITANKPVKDTHGRWR